MTARRRIEGWPFGLATKKQDHAKLEFIGTVRNNKGKFQHDMVLPGWDSLCAAPDDWPAQFEPGTLNIGIEADGFPADFDDIGRSKGVRRLDEGKFNPAFVIAQHEITGNTLKPKDGQPHRGTGQVWRAELSVISTGASAKCWMLRRIGSRIASQIELVSEDHLRSRLNLDNGTHVKITVFEG